MTATQVFAKAPKKLIIDCKKCRKTNITPVVEEQLWKKK